MEILHLVSLVLPSISSPSPCVSVAEETVDEEAEKEKRRAEYVRTYVSPWERAMKGNEELTATMKSCMPGPIKMHADLPLYKSFNRYMLNSFTNMFFNCSACKESGKVVLINDVIFGCSS